MVTPDRQTQLRTIKVLQLAFLAGIFIYAAVGVVLGYVIGPTLGGSESYVIAAVLFFVAIVGLVTVRVLMTATLTQQPGQLQAAAILGLAFAEAPAIYGMIAALLTGQGWIAIPFALFSLYMWQLTRNFVNETVTSISEEFPRI